MKQTGFSMIELLIALLLGTILSSMVLTIFVSNSQAFRQTSSYGRMQENGRYAIRRISNDLRSVSHIGLTSTDPINNTITKIVPNDCGAPITAYQIKVANSGLWVIRKGNIGGSGEDYNLNDYKKDNCLVNHVADTDVLVIRGVISPAMNYDKSKTPKISTRDMANIKTNRSYILGTHTSSYLIPGFTNVSAFPTRFNATKAVIWEYVEWIYYIKDPDTANDTDMHQLIKLELTNLNRTAQVIAEGVERMRLKFGIDTDNDGTPNYYTDADQINEISAPPPWSDVTVAKVYLLMQSDYAVFQDDEKSYILGDNSATDTIAQTDLGDSNRFRIVVNSTVELRNHSIAATGVFR